MYLCICSLLFVGCEKNDDLPEKDPGNYQTPLPAATTTGANIFACYVDGKAYIAKKNAITAYNQYYQGRYGIHNTFYHNGCIDVSRNITRNPDH